MRYAYAGILKTSDSNETKVVVKESIFEDEMYNSFKFHKDLLENQVISAFLARKYFENFSLFQKDAKFIEVNLIKIASSNKDIYYSIESFIPNEFVKWSCNDGYINRSEYSNTLDSFAHWTYQITSEYLLVCDLQGFIIDKKQYVLTDPAIICPEDNYRFSETNLGINAVHNFFANHQCNPFCKALNLKKHYKQTKPDLDDASGTILPTLRKLGKSTSNRVLVDDDPTMMPSLPIKPEK